MHFVEVGAWQGLKPKAHPKHLRGAEAPLFHGKTALMAFFSNLLEESEGSRKKTYLLRLVYGFPADHGA
jgi:hypothetical protein